MKIKKKFCYKIIIKSIKEINDPQRLMLQCTIFSIAYMYILHTVQYSTVIPCCSQKLGASVFIVGLG